MSLLEPDPEERPDPAFWENTYHNPPRGRRPRRPRRPSFPGTPGRRDHGRGHGLLIDPDDEPGLLGPDDYGSGLLDGGDYRPEPGPPGYPGYGSGGGSGLLGGADPDADFDDDDDLDPGPGLLARFGPAPLGRSRWRPAPGWGSSRDPDQPRGRITRQQRAAALLLAAACLGGVTWYVAHGTGGGGHSFSGTVLTNAVVDLTFARAGQVSEISVQAGQQVRGGELLAAEAVPATARVAAARESVAADRAALTRLTVKSSPAGPAVAIARAKLKRDRVLVAAELAQIAQGQIEAPMSGTVIAVNAQVGQAVSATGVRDFLVQAGQQVPMAQQTPAASVGAAASATVAAIALRTSLHWQVMIVVPANMTARVKPGEAATITVPAAKLSSVPGRVEGLLPTPVRTMQGLDYQALVSVVGQQPAPPLSGMAAEVQLGS